jgi:hypothetical protein
VESAVLTIVAVMDRTFKMDYALNALLDAFLVILDKIARNAMLD